MVSSLASGGGLKVSWIFAFDLSLGKGIFRHNYYGENRPNQTFVPDALPYGALSCFVRALASPLTFARQGRVLLRPPPVEAKPKPVDIATRTIHAPVSPYSRLLQRRGRLIDFSGGHGGIFGRGDRRGPRGGACGPAQGARRVLAVEPRSRNPEGAAIQVPAGLTRNASLTATSGGQPPFRGHSNTRLGGHRVRLPTVSETLDRASSPPPKSNYK